MPQDGWAWKGNYKAMKKKKVSVAGRLYYTFGSMLLAAVVIVCAVNFSNDGRRFEKSLPVIASESSAQGSSNDGEESSPDSIKTLKYTKKTESKPASGGKKTKTEADGKQEETSPPASDAPASTVNPGETP